MPKPEVIIKQLERKEETLYKRRKKIDEELDILNNLMYKQQVRIQNAIRAKQKRCKHNEGNRRTLNCRDDASFKYWLFCNKCGADRGSEGEPDSTPY